MAKDLLMDLDLRFGQRTFYCFLAWTELQYLSIGSVVMDFINPKIDFAFKKIFGNEQHKEVLISFLNAILYGGQPTIETLEFIDPYNAPKYSGLKDTFLDVRARLDNSLQVIIEMQMLAVKGFGKRVLYNATKAYSTQLKPRGDYTTLSPVIGLTIMDFKLFTIDKVKGVLSRFELYDKVNDVEYPVKDIELVFVELPKFKKTVETLETIMDKWLYFMRYASELEEIPGVMKMEPAIEQAFQIANRVNLSQEELDELERREFFVRDMHRLVEVAEQKAEEKGIKEGIKEGKREGKREGIKEGKKEKAIEIAIKLLDVLDDETISQKTELTLDEVRKLRQSQSAN